MALNNVFERLLSAQMGAFFQNILSEYISPTGGTIAVRHLYLG